MPQFHSPFAPYVSSSVCNSAEVLEAAVDSDDRRLCRSLGATWLPHVALGSSARDAVITRFLEFSPHPFGISLTFNHTTQEIPDVNLLRKPCSSLSLTAASSDAFASQQGTGAPFSGITRAADEWYPKPGDEIADDEKGGTGCGRRSSTLPPARRRSACAGAKLATTLRLPRRGCFACDTVS